MAMLEVKDLHVHYGMIEALKGVSLTVEEGQIVSLIGANGAGKTTLLQSISGIVKKSGGEVMFLGNDIYKASPQKIVAQGLTQVPEGRRIFTGLSVYENLMMGAYLRKDKKESRRICKNLQTVSDFGAEKRAGRLHVVGWRAANAGDGTRLDGQAEAFAAR